MKVMSYNTLFGDFDGANEGRYKAQVELHVAISLPRTIAPALPP